MKYKIIAISNWESPQIFEVDDIKEAKELKSELRNHQYLVEIEEVKE